MTDKSRTSQILELKRLVQIGIVVRDLERTTQLLGALFGLGPFQFIEWPDRSGSKYYYRGEEKPIKLRQAFVQVGPIELEFVEVVEGDCNAYREFLEQTGGGIHHVLFEVDDINDVIKALSDVGIDVVQSGTGIRPGTSWALLDTNDQVGFFVELRHRAPGSDGTSIP
jgi:catechol 2,3-dioxygenase-like lactoylglutathione lyase family enzyme